MDHRVPTNGKVPGSSQRAFARQLTTPAAAPVAPANRRTSTRASGSDFRIGDWDVYLGRGSYNAWRPGNARLHALVDRFMSQYDAASGRKTKTSIIQKIYDEISSQGRFLGKDEDTGQYQAVDEAFAKKKIGHAFRDRRRKGRQEAAKAAAKNSTLSVATSDEEEEEKEEHSKMPASENATGEPPAPLPPNIPPSRRPPPPLASTRPNITSVAAASQALAAQQEVAQDQKDDDASSSSSIFSDEELLSVLGTPGEYRG